MDLPRIPAFYFDRDRLLALARQRAPAFRAAAPFPHAVFDDFLPPEVADLLAAEFPGPEDIRWDVYDLDATTHLRKLGCSDDTQFGPFTRHVTSQLLSQTFLTFLETLTGVGHLITDPSHNQCGLHSTGPGGKVAVHTDINRHPIPGRLHQQANVILYLNRDWPEEYGGHLEFWNRDLTRAEQRILPVANRLLVFETDALSYHGHPQPLTCPPDRRRNSLALYFYTLDRPTTDRYAGLKDIDWVATQPDEKRLARQHTVRRVVKSLVPPVVLDVWRRFKRKRS